MPLVNVLSYTQKSVSLYPFSKGHALSDMTMGILQSHVYLVVFFSTFNSKTQFIQRKIQCHTKEKTTENN